MSVHSDDSQFHVQRAKNAARASTESRRRKSRQNDLADHVEHVRLLGPFVERMGAKAPTSADAKAILTKGKVVLGSLFGDRSILMAMKTNEDDTNKAYARACAREDLPADLRGILERNLGDERRHRDYLERRLSESRQAAAPR